MKERPILFGGPMVRAILEGRKTQTRRPMDPQPTVYQGYETGENHDDPGWCLDWKDSEDGMLPKDLARLCPFGQVGDRLWVRETWSPDATRMYPCPKAWYRASDPIEPSEGYHRCPEKFRDEVSYADCLACWEEDHGPFRWRPSIHMPRRASRITLEVTGVRVARIQETSHDDAISEGVDAWIASLEDTTSELREQPLTLKQLAFSRLWDSVYGGNLNHGGGPLAWAQNPWVWVVEFRRIQQ